MDEDERSESKLSLDGLTVDEIDRLRDLEEALLTPWEKMDVPKGVVVDADGEWEREVNKQQLYHRKWRINQRARKAGRELNSLELDECHRIDDLLHSLRKTPDLTRRLSPIEEMLVTLSERVEYLILIVEGGK